MSTLADEVGDMLDTEPAWAAAVLRAAVAEGIDLYEDRPDAELVCGRLIEGASAEFLPSALSSSYSGSGYLRT